MLSLWFLFPRFSRERASREESWERGRSERGATDWRLESTNGKTASRRSEEKEAGEIDHSYFYEYHSFLCHHR